MIQLKYMEFTVPKYFPLFKPTIVNGHLVAGTGLDEILGDTSIDTASLQTAAVDENNIHNARCFVQLSAVSIYTCLKKAHEASYSELALFSWAEQVLHLDLCLSIG